MTEISPTDAAFEGFRLTREHPRAMLWWSAAYLLISLAMNAVLVSLFGDKLAALQASAVSPPAPAQAEAMMADLAPLYAVVIPYGLIVLAIFPAAVFRMVLRPSDRGLGYLKLGADELRLIAVTLIYTGLAVATVFVVVLVAGLMAVLLGGLTGPAAGMIGVMIAFLTVGALVYLTVRLSLAGPMTFAERRVDIFGSWRLTRGHFWPMFGAYALSFALAMVVLVLAALIFTLVAAVISGKGFLDAGGFLNPKLDTLSGMLEPGVIAVQVAQAFCQALYYALIFSPGAVVYRALAEGRLRNVYA